MGLVAQASEPRVGRHVPWGPRPAMSTGTPMPQLSPTLAQACETTLAPA